MSNEKKKIEVAGQAAIRALLKGVEAGDHAFAVKLELRGVLRKGEDHEAVVAQKACAITMLAAAIDRLNAVTKVTVADLVDEVQALDEVERKAMRDRMKKDTEAAMAAIGASCRQVVSGRTTFPSLDVQVEEIEEEEE